MDNKRMKQFVLKLTLKQRVPEAPYQNYKLPQLLPIWHICRPITLCYMLLKQKTCSPNPLWQRFHICVYTKDAHDDVMDSVRRCNTEICVLEQKFNTWPNTQVNLSLDGEAGEEVTPLTVTTHKFCSPNHGQEFQRAFPLYFKRSTESGNKIRLNFHINIPNSTPINIPVLFNWREPETNEMEQKQGTKISVRGYNAIGIQKNKIYKYKRLKRNRTCPDMSGLDKQNDNLDGTFASCPNESSGSTSDTESSELSSTEVASIENEKGIKTGSNLKIGMNVDDDDGLVLKSQKSDTPMDSKTDLQGENEKMTLCESGSTIGAEAVNKTHAGGILEPKHVFDQSEQGNRPSPTMDESWYYPEEEEETTKDKNTEG